MTNTENRTTEPARAGGGTDQVKLGRLQPRRKVLGKWVGYVALAVTLVSVLATQFLGPFPAAGLCAVAAFIGIKALDSRGRGVAFVSVFLAVLLLIVNLCFGLFFHDISFHAPTPPS